MMPLRLQRQFDFEYHVQHLRFRFFAKKRFHGHLFLLSFSKPSRDKYFTISLKLVDNFQKCFTEHYVIVCIT